MVEKELKKKKVTTKKPYTSKPLKIVKVLTNVTRDNKP